MNGNKKSIGKIYNLNERYVYVEDKEQGIKARISRNFLNNITNEEFLNDFKNLPLINFEYRENKKTENGIYIGYINSPKLENESEVIYKKGEIHQFKLFHIDNEQFKIEYNGYVFTQQFPDYYSSLKIYLYSCFNKGINSVELRYVKWNNKLDSSIFEYPYITNETTSCNEVKGKLIFVREQRIKKNTRLGDVFYFKDSYNYIHRVDDWGFYDYSNYFNIDDEVDLIINKFDIFEKIINSKFKNVFEKKYQTKKYKTGDELIAKVLNRSGSVDLNKLTPIDKCHGVGLKGCRVVHGGGRRLATNDRRGGQLGAHRRFHFMQPLVKAASSIAKPALAFCHQDLNDHVHCCTS